MDRNIINFILNAGIAAEKLNTVRMNLQSGWSYEDEERNGIFLREDEIENLDPVAQKAIKCAQQAVSDIEDALLYLNYEP